MFPPFGAVIYPLQAVRQAERNKKDKTRPAEIYGRPTGLLRAAIKHLCVCQSFFSSTSCFPLLRPTRAPSSPTRSNRLAAAASSAAPFHADTIRKLCYLLLGLALCAGGWPFATQRTPFSNNFGLVTARHTKHAPRRPSTQAPGSATAPLARS